MKESSLPGFKKMIDYEMIGIKKPVVLNKKTSCNYILILLIRNGYYKNYVINICQTLGN